MTRKYNNSHNGLNGSVRMLLTHVSRIRRAPSLTPRGRALIVEVEVRLMLLDKETWAFRRELDGSTSLMNHKNKRRFTP